MDQVSRYHPLLVALHWLMAVLIIAALSLGALVMAHIPNTDPMKLEALRSHMSGGILILTLMLVRLILRTRTQRPAAATTHNALLDRIAWVSHRLFYVAVFAMAGTGLFLAVQARLFDIVFRGHGALPPDLWVFPMRTVHYLLSRLLMALIVLHVVAVLYHTLVLRDGLLRRIFFGRRALKTNTTATTRNRPLSGA
jgi:cytochrome b561